MNKIIYLIPVFALMLLGVFFYAHNNPNPKALMIYKPIPPFSTERLWVKDSNFTDKDLPAAPHIVHFFSTWCAACQEEHELIMQLAKIHNIPIYGIAYRDAPEDVQKFLSDKGNPYIATSLDRSGENARICKLKRTPSTYVIDKHKQIRYQHDGALSKQHLTKIVLPIIEILKQEK
tara:strand:+ start:199 stop:726 length:528 start_codon:yes stop_codon:yes gene_type:complete